MLFTYISKRLGQLLGLPLAGVLMLGSAALPQPESEVALLGLDPNTDNLFSAMGNMLPGESETGHFRIYNRGSAGGFFYLQTVTAGAEAIPDPQKQAESDRLLAALEMEVALHSGSGRRLLYRGKANQVLNEGADTEFMVGATVLLGYLAPGEAVDLEATVKVPDWLDNSYAGTEGMFYWNFYSIQAEIAQPPDTPGEPEPEEEDPPPTLWKMPSATAVQPGGLVGYSMGGFANPLDETAYSLTVSDIVPDGLHFLSASLPAFTGGSSATYSIEYTTNQNGKRRLESGLPASQPYALSTPALAAGEWVTTLSVVFDEVPPGFGEGDQITLLFRLDESVRNEGEILNHSMLFYSSGNGSSATIEGAGRGIHADDGNGRDARSQIVSSDTALGAFNRQNTWSLANLMLTVFSCLTAAVLFLYTLVKPLQQRLPHKQRQVRGLQPQPHEATATDEASSPEVLWKLPLPPYILSVLSCLFMLVCFVYFENISLTTVLFNARTLLFLLLSILNLLLSVVCIRGRRQEPEGGPEDKPEPPPPSPKKPRKDPIIFAGHKPSHLQ